MTSTDRPADCQARAESDEMVCAACRLRWPSDDRTPPPCNPIPADPMQPADNIRIHPRWKTWRHKP